MKAPKAKKYVDKCFNSAQANMDDRQIKKACDIAYNEGLIEMKAKAIKSYCTFCDMKNIVNCKSESPECPFLEYFVRKLK